jgi:ABC-type transporter Mla MlaB component
MKVFTKGAVTHLHGDLTHSGVTDYIINSLAVSLRKLANGGKGHFRIDCTMVRSADICGLQLLYVWMQCARFFGVEPKLINLSDQLQLDILRMGLGHCFPVPLPINNLGG